MIPTRTLGAFFAIALLFLASFISRAEAQRVSPDGFWQQTDKLPAAPANARVEIQPTKFKTFTLDAGLLRNALTKAPMEFTSDAARPAPVQITLPMPDGTFARFEIEESPVMEPELAAKFPGIKSYAGRGLDDRTARLRLDINERTFQAQILSPNGAVYIDPYWQRDGRLYISYAKSDLYRDAERFRCLVDGGNTNSEVEGPLTIENSNSGKMLRTYRLACATSAQYSQYHSPLLDVTEVMAALVTMVNRVSGVYQNELAVRMVLVANNDQLVFTATNPTPFTDTPGDLFLNPAFIDNKIGASSYDIGHVVTVGSGGVAGLGVVCRGLNASYGGSAKAAGTTGLNPPVNDPFWIDYVAHEMGHQFGGNHTFNGNGTNCGAANQNASTAYEPGSGSTIQAYAGICGANNNLQSNSDPYFHFISIQEMWNYTNTGLGNPCAAQTPTGNNPPTVSARGPGIPAFPAVAYTMPDETPFALTAFDGVDPENDPLTYCWEEADIGPEKAGNAADNGSSALFRSWNPTANPRRTFPRWSDLLLNNTQTIGEKLPLTNRKLDFKVTARDNRGGYQTDTIKLMVVNTGTGFKVLTPNTAVTWAGGSTQTVTWDVAGTTANGINTANVDILLSTDATPATGEPSFPIVLAANTPNDGSETVTIPSVATTKARVMVAARGNVYFDISNTNFTITAPTTVPLSGIASRKVHGANGTYDVALPLTPPYGIECRSGGAANDYTLVFTFGNNLASVGSASVTAGTAVISSSAIGANPNEYIVELTGVSDIQTVAIALNNVSDTLGGLTPSLTATMEVLVGDTSANRMTNSSDIGQTKAQSGQNTNGTNFRTDVAANGAINSSDIGLVKSKSGNNLP